MNLGIVAHVDAGKTSLTERLLYEAGVLDEPGSVDAGSTRTDTMELERRRGITIRAAVASFVVHDQGGDVTVNLIDTPGHSDFIAEVERALTVLDGAVLVVSAVEGVQAQTVVLYRALHRLGIPTTFFVNKVDRMGARPAQVVDDLRRRLAPQSVALQRVNGAGTPAAQVVAESLDGPAAYESTLEVVAAVDDGVLEAATDGTSQVPHSILQQQLRSHARRGTLHPVLFGSAITGAGVRELLELLATLLPVHDADAEGAASGSVFKVERGPAAEKLVYLTLGAGTVHVRDRVDLGRGGPAKVTALKVFVDGELVDVDAVAAGQIAMVRGWETARIGDRIGTDPAPRRGVHEFARPSLETVVSAVDPRQRSQLHQGLTQLAEQDPLIDVRQDDARGQLSVSLYGEVQKEVIAGLLESEYGVAVSFTRSTPLCIERVVGTGAAVELIGWATNPYLAGVGLRVEPAPVGSGVRLDLEVERGSMPAAFFAAVEDSAATALLQGPHGWQVPDCRLTMTHSGYWGRHSIGHAAFTKSISSTAADFRYLTPLVLMTALLRAGTLVCEPMHRFQLEAPEAAQRAVLTALPAFRAVPLATRASRTGLLIEGMLPAGRVHELFQQVPDLTRGEGSLTTAFDSHQPVVGPSPERPRTDDDPTDPDRYLRVTARASGRSWPMART